MGSAELGPAPQRDQLVEGSALGVQGPAPQRDQLVEGSALGVPRDEVGLGEQ